MLSLFIVQIIATDHYFGTMFIYSRDHAYYFLNERDIIYITVGFKPVEWRLNEN